MGVKIPLEQWNRQTQTYSHANIQIYNLSLQSRWAQESDGSRAHTKRFGRVVVRRRRPYNCAYASNDKSEQNVRTHNPITHCPSSTTHGNAHPNPPTPAILRDSAPHSLSLSAYLSFPKSVSRHASHLSPLSLHQSRRTQQANERHLDTSSATSPYKHTDRESPTDP